MMISRERCLKNMLEELISGDFTLSVTVARHAVDKKKCSDVFKASKAV